MLNYIKSEFYRITHSAMLYAVGFAFAAAPTLMNIMLYCFTLSKPDYPFSTTSFSFSNVVANPMIFCVAALFLVYALYEGNKKNGNLKNAIASGLSRGKIFIGQVIVSLVVSIIFLAITAMVYIFSARLLLRIEGPVTAFDLIMEILAVAPITVAALILSVVVVMRFDKSIMGIIWWLCILFFVPQLLLYIGIEIEPVREIAMWLPRNFFSGMQVNQTVCAPIWDAADGLAKCLISGFIGIIVFGIYGIVSLRKKEF